MPVRPAIPDSRNGRVGVRHCRARAFHPLTDSASKCRALGRQLDQRHRRCLWAQLGYDNTSHYRRPDWSRRAPRGRVACLAKEALVALGVAPFAAPRCALLAGGSGRTVTRIRESGRAHGRNFFTEPTCRPNCWLKLRTHGASKNVGTARWISRAVLIAAIARIAESESPPRSKNDSSTPT
jgi:hypothetical protein